MFKVTYQWFDDPEEREVPLPLEFSTEREARQYADYGVGVHPDRIYYVHDSDGTCVYATV